MSPKSWPPSSTPAGSKGGIAGKFETSDHSLLLKGGSKIDESPSAHPQASAGLRHPNSASAPQNDTLPTGKCLLRSASRTETCKRESPKFRIATIEKTRKEKALPQNHCPLPPQCVPLAGCWSRVVVTEEELALVVVEGQSSRKEHGPLRVGVCEERVLASCILVKRDQGEEREREQRKGSRQSWGEGDAASTGVWPEFLADIVSDQTLMTSQFGNPVMREQEEGAAQLVAGRPVPPPPAVAGPIQGRPEPESEPKLDPQPRSTRIKAAPSPAANPRAPA
ncbi:hypothetical protein B0H17DRAFT_1139090 [Mycena rosella]|uniref:Uncharacterized protein n=1 Tax=Mycena rosella TaxID=1033263 RepID=A0AAD7D4Y9_MYCRO|nr:hypothetical protein B0H17DRAFT_1139090 [Mycena rosella]